MHNYQKAIAHARQYNLTPSKMTDRWFYFLESMQDAVLECSIKVSQHEIYPWRYHLWFDTHIQKMIPICLNFIGKYGFTQGKVNFTKFDSVFGVALDAFEIARLVFGVDFRKEISETRFKIWFVVTEYNEALLDMLSTSCGLGTDFTKFLIHQQILIGFDFYSSGQSQIKVYPVLFQKDIREQRTLELLQSVFSPNILNLMMLCDRFHVGIKEGSSDRILHFHPKDWKHFVNILSQTYDIGFFRQAIHRIESSNLQEVFLSLSQCEMNEGAIENINFYYM